MFSRRICTPAQRDNVAQDNKTDPGRSPGKDLISKIAKAYRNMPAESREKPRLDQHDIQNPELDQVFDKMIEMYKAEPPAKEEPVVTLPISPPLSVPNERRGAAGQADALPAPRQRIERHLPKPAAPRPVKVKQVHLPQAKQRYRTNPYLLLAVVLLMGVIAWQQWGVRPPSAARPVAAPALQAPAPVPRAPAQPSPRGVGASPAAVPVQSSAKPGKRPSVRPSPARSSVAESARPLPIAAPGPSGPPIAPYQSLTERPMPVLPSFASRPPKPESAK